MASITNQIQPFTYTGTGAALTITLGFRPSFVLAFNQTDGDTIWGMIDGMTAATGFSVVLATAAATNGCTITDTGFTLGTSAVLNETGKVYWGFAA